MKQILFIIVLALSMAFVSGIMTGNERSEPSDTTLLISGVDTTFPICINGEWYDSTQTERIELGCNESGRDINGNIVTNCCPSGFSCNIQTGECEEGRIILTSCGNFTTESSCMGATPQQIKNSIYERIKQRIIEERIDFDVDEITEADFCLEDNFIEFEQEGSCITIGGPCRCRWITDSSTSNGGRCIESFPIDIDNSCRGEPPPLGSLTCETRSSFENKCDSEGIYILSVISTIVDSSGRVVTDSSGRNLENAACKSERKVLACPSPRKASVPFFSFFNLFFALFLILILYLLISILKKR